jgi:hypothetical protein
MNTNQNNQTCLGNISDFVKKHPVLTSFAACAAILAVGAAVNKNASNFSSSLHHNNLDSTDRDNLAYWETEDGPAYPKGDWDSADSIW